ncbi:metal-dependent hydrolase [Bacillus mojavensis]|nr:metal-dependent hydrolase [Bacillus mojavensis]MEC1688222.1 metal-dependent hydrolase [Bacillus mojavensis]
MTGKTHIMGGIASCTAAAYYYGFDPVLMAASGAVGALIPDICHTQSKIGRRFPFRIWPSHLYTQPAVSSHHVFYHSYIYSR